MQRLIVLVSIVAAVPALSTSTLSQTSADGPAAITSELTSMADCARPEDAKEAKVIEFDAGKSLAKLAVNLGSGRFKLVRITVWDRPDDPRPLAPVVEAARIMQGTVQFYTPALNLDPESAHDSFVLVADMGGGPVCWATSTSLLNEKGRPGAKPEARGVGDPAPRTEAQPNAESVNSAATSVPTDMEAVPDTPTAAVPLSKRRSPTPPRSAPVQ
jgi:hypothetical protein